ncbi:alpha-glucuronidase [Paenibacillus polymyxa]|uniref:alpha-glucuronidase family glycosyl hydrolase n=1 Tax=Paenibacillus polymyxa TaxID=1406 RepID=UPI0004D7CD49|nr:alpha-glucuronidase family glycosyl hydrolase [Paenibacillus polymyxa]KEO78891.1 alpha-glucuronidase [Paenibacillus polymyxa]MCH6187822.1 alpha-glucuronidase [Paenibacillus polymyxa]WRL57297.1 alpha-glucuronidase family glycosyl hydrolase [Paenibacillus polymyxa]
MSKLMDMPKESGYAAWLHYSRNSKVQKLPAWCRVIVVHETDEVLQSAASELQHGLTSMFGQQPKISAVPVNAPFIALGTFPAHPLVAERFSAEEQAEVGAEGYRIRGIEMPYPEYSALHSNDEFKGQYVTVAGQTSKGVLYGVFHLLRYLQGGLDGKLKPAAEESLHAPLLDLLSNPANPIRMINHWDNMDGSIERGYAGGSIFYDNNTFTANMERLRDYARLLASVGIQALSINNVNVHQVETELITDKFLPDVAKVAAVFRAYGIQIYLSINYASPIQLGGLTTADPLEPAVAEWWQTKAQEVYAAVPDLGGFVVKADSENRPGPFSYGRHHADGANMLADALQPYGGRVIWRCFVYNCKQDWRDRKTDRARAAFDHFKPLDGLFRENVILQIKNGPMDFQVREPVSPLFGALEATQVLLEFQIAQEYTGQQKHLCYLVPQWKEVLDFDTYAQGKGSTIKRIVSGALHSPKPANYGIAAVSNIGADTNWTGHLLAQSNLYGYGRLAWDPELSAEEIADEWVRLTFGRQGNSEGDPDLIFTIKQMLLNSWNIYESYTAPLGVGWMVSPDHHYGPDVDGYEYSKWGTYHFADCRGIGVDRTTATGTGYAGQYFSPPADIYESTDTCPDELLLFFHHVPYAHLLHSGQTIIQHIYDTHFEGAERAAHLRDTWVSLRGQLNDTMYEQVLERLEHQAEHAKEWRDRINTYFYRKSGIADQKDRPIY